MTHVKRDSRAPAIRMAKLFVRPPLPNLLETEAQQQRRDLARLENWDGSHTPPSRDSDRMDAEELRLELGIAVLEKHLDYLTQILLEFIQCAPLAMSAGPTGNRPDVEVSVRIALDDDAEGAHVVRARERADYPDAGDSQHRTSPARKPLMLSRGPRVVRLDHAAGWSRGPPAPA